LLLFSAAVAFDVLWFRNGTTYHKSKTFSWSGNDWSSF